MHPVADLLEHEAKRLAVRRALVRLGDDGDQGEGHADGR
jgi:hypothetical protein